MKPIEAMARALYDFGPHGAHPDMSLRQYWDAQAKHALTALRDCGVTGAIDQAFLEQTTGGSWTTSQAVFRAMLDAAMEG